MSKTETPKRGRPFLSDEDRRDYRVFIKVNLSERKAIDDAAAAAGTSVAEFVRETILKAARRKR